MDRSTLGHAVLAIVSTVAAYAAYAQPNLVDKDDSVVVFAGVPTKLKRIEWRDEVGMVTLMRDNDGILVTTSKDILPRGMAAKPDNPNPPATAELWPGTEQAKDLFQKLAPLLAARKLGPLDPEKTKALGLDAPQSHLELEYDNGNKNTLEVGGSAFGSGDYYARGPDGSTYLLRSNTLSSLGHGALSLQDRNAVGLLRPQFDHVVIKFAGQERKLSQRYGDEPGKAFFADPAEPDRKLENLSSWLDRVLRLRVTELLKEAPGGEPTLILEFYRDKSRIRTLKVWSVGDKGAVALTDHFKTPVMLFKGGIEAVLRDAEGALAEGK